MSTETIASLLAEGVIALADLETPDLDARFLLEGASGLTAQEINVERSRPLDDASVAAFREFIERRRKGEPVAYILGEWEFWSLTLAVTPAVLIPRPSTELLVQWGVELLRSVEAPRAIDVGTGCGAIAIALAMELPRLEVLAVDLSTEALEVAGENIRRHNLQNRVKRKEADLLTGIDGSFDLVVSNPPYVVRGEEALERAVEEHEPASSLFDNLDGDGLGYFRRLAKQAPPILSPRGALLMEIGETQGAEVLEIVSAAGLVGELRGDLEGHDRAVVATIAGAQSH